MPFEFPEPGEHEAAGLRVFVPAGTERAMERRRELGETGPLPVPELHELHTILRAMVARWPSVYGLKTAVNIITNTTVAWVSGYHPNQEQRLNMMRHALRCIQQGEDNHAKTWPDPDDAACDIMLEDLLGQPPNSLRGFILDEALLALENERRRALYAGRRVGEAANPGPSRGTLCAGVRAPGVRWRAFPCRLCAFMLLIVGVMCAPDGPAGCGAGGGAGGVAGPSGTCWAGRSLPAGPRR